MNPEWLVCCLAEIWLSPGEFWGQKSWEKCWGSLQPLPALSSCPGVAPGGSTVTVLLESSMGVQEVLILKKSERKEDMEHKVYSWEPSTA